VPVVVFVNKKQLNRPREEVVVVMVAMAGG